MKESGSLSLIRDTFFVYLLLYTYCIDTSVLLVSFVNRIYIFIHLFIFWSRRYIKHSRHCFIGCSNSSNFWKVLCSASYFQFSFRIRYPDETLSIVCDIYHGVWIHLVKARWKPHILWNSILFILPYFSMSSQMSVVEFDEPPSWSLDVSETGRVQNARG